MLDLKAWISKVTNRLTYDSIKVVHNITLTSSGSISAGGNCAVKSTNVSSHIPTGYKLVWATLRGTQNSNAVCWYFEWFEGSQTVEYRLRNVGSSALTTSPTANLFLVYVGGVVRRLLNTLKMLTLGRGWALC